MHEKFPPIFSPRSFAVLSLMFRSLFHYESIKRPTSLFVCEYPGFLALFVEETALLPLSGLVTLVKDHLSTYSRVYFRAPYSTSLAYKHCFDYHFIICF